MDLVIMVRTKCVCEDLYDADQRNIDNGSGHHQLLWTLFFAPAV